MSKPKPREADPFGAAANAIQKASPPTLSIFADTADEEGQQYKDVWDVEVLDLNFDREKMKWRDLHNNPNIEIISETEKTSRISTLTYIKFIRRTPIDEPEEEFEPFSEPCEEDDPLVDEMWGE